MTIHRIATYCVKACTVALVMVALLVASDANAGGSKDEKQIRAVQDLFAKGIMTKDAKLRASIFAADATLVPPTGGFFADREAIQRDFEQESASITDKTNASFSNYRFRFITHNAAFVDADLAINDIVGPDGKPIPMVKVAVVFIAVRRGGKWLVQDERAHFVPVTPEGDH